MVTKDKQWWTFEVLGPSMIYNGFNREISCHHVTMSLCHCVTTSLHHRITVPLCHHITTSLHHHITASLHHRVITSPCHHISQSFVLLPATKPVSHLPCPLPPNQSVIWLALYHHITVSPWPPCHHITIPLHHCTTASLQHRVTTPLHHHVTTSPWHFPQHMGMNLIS